MKEKRKNKKAQAQVQCSAVWIASFFFSENKTILIIYPIIVSWPSLITLWLFESFGINLFTIKKWGHYMCCNAVSIFANKRLPPLEFSTNDRIRCKSWRHWDVTHYLQHRVRFRSTKFVCKPSTGSLSRENSQILYNISGVEKIPPLSYETSQTSQFLNFSLIFRSKRKYCECPTRAIDSSSCASSHAPSSRIRRRTGMLNFNAYSPGAISERQPSFTFFTSLLPLRIPSQVCSARTKGECPILVIFSKNFWSDKSFDNLTTCNFPSSESFESLSRDTNPQMPFPPSVTSSLIGSLNLLQLLPILRSPCMWAFLIVSACRIK